jgi:hypothetical protein
MNAMNDTHGTEPTDLLLVQHAGSFSSDGGTMTLHGISAATVYFRDSPPREIGHLSSRRLVEGWDDGDGSFGSDPPTAVLSFVQEADGDGTPSDVVVRLRAPRLVGGDVSYDIEVVDGELPTVAGPCSLFIERTGADALQAG